MLFWQRFLVQEHVLSGPYLFKTALIIQHTNIASADGQQSRTRGLVKWRRGTMEACCRRS